jgi:hypothetical protein
VPQFDGHLLDGGHATILGIHEGGCHFSLCCGGHDWTKEGAQDIDWSIQWWALARREFGWICAEELVAGSGFCLWLSEVRGIGVAFVDHVTGVEVDCDVGVSGCIVEEAPTGFENCLCSFGLSHCDGAEGD